MKTAFFSTKPYDRVFFDEANRAAEHALGYFEAHLTFDTAPLAAGCEAVCVFVNDRLDRATLQRLHDGGTRCVALRSAGYNNVDLAAAREIGLRVVRVPAYSPHAVAEHAVALLLALNRRICRASSRVREGNFSLDGLLGFDLYGKTAGVVGTGKIGECVTRILQGFGCRVIAYDPQPSPACQAAGVPYVKLDELYSKSDVISLHCPLLPSTRHLVDDAAIERMKTGVMILNTGRGALIDTGAVIRGLKRGKIGSLGLDVYEEEEKLFFEDLSGQIIQDDLFMRLLTFPNVLITGHQAFFTREAMTKIAETTLGNLAEFARGGPLTNEVL